MEGTGSRVSQSSLGAVREMARTGIAGLAAAKTYNYAGRDFRLTNVAGSKHGVSR